VVFGAVASRKSAHSGRFRGSWGSLSARHWSTQGYDAMHATFAVAGHSGGGSAWGAGAQQCGATVAEKWPGDRGVAAACCV
jgi:hypothetical protein